MIPVTYGQMLEDLSRWLGRAAMEEVPEAELEATWNREYQARVCQGCDGRGAVFEFPSWDKCPDCKGRTDRTVYA